MSAVLDCLRGHGDRIAVITDATELTYRDLAQRVVAAAEAIGSERRLVMLETRNDLTTLVHYLGALAGGHVVMPVPSGRDHSALVQTYRPDVVIDECGVHHRQRPGHRMHEDLALLLSTSGSTGSPKMVRLSHDNVRANATVIADYLDIRETDRAATTLPMSYCYGLSVIHSHLLAGAAVILTDRSVVDAEFWESFRRHRGTSFAGVPYTFELLDRAGIENLDLPHLRYVTQAGGRMAADRVRHFAELGRRKGFDLFVMYGATEATARMAYLPPQLAATRPGAVGLPVPGGSFAIEPVDGWSDEEVGELVYRGPNVMMGYAHQVDDLALGKTVDALHTGDIARIADDGLYEIIGRTSRFAKIYGLRIDLQRIETRLRDCGVAAFCTSDNDQLLVAATGRHPDLRRVTAEIAGIPSGAVRVVAVDELPLLESGKPDYQSVRRMALAVDDRPSTDLRAMFADVLQMEPTAIDPDASFVDLGGNSLSYVAMTVRLERAIGQLPTNWHQMSVRELAGLAHPRRRLWAATMETSVALRAVAIVLIVGSHAALYEMWGGAHVLLGVAGYNFGRFCLTPVPRATRIRHLRNTIAWIALPSLLWIAVALLVTNDYAWTNLLLANKFLGPHDSMTAGRLWFIEVLVWTLVALMLLLWLPAVDRLERRLPFAVAMLALAVGLALRYDILRMHLGENAWFTILAFWFFALGWAASKAPTAWARVAVTVAMVVGLHGYFDTSLRHAVVLGGLALLIWVPTVRCPPALAVLAGMLAEASLFTYLVHFQVYGMLRGHPAVGVVASLAVGVLVTYLVTVIRRRLRASLSSRRQVAPARITTLSAMSRRD